MFGSGSNARVFGYGDRPLVVFEDGGGSGVGAAYFEQLSVQPHGMLGCPLRDTHTPPLLSRATLFVRRNTY